MSQSDVSSDAIQQALNSLYSTSSREFEVTQSGRNVLLQLSTDIAAFSVLEDNLHENFQSAYGEFKQLYRQNHKAWDDLTLSFVICRTSVKATDDLFFAELEHDPLFCRKYIIRAFNDITKQRRELLRLPFLPLPNNAEGGLERPPSAQDLLQSTGITASLSRKLAESHVKGGGFEAIAKDLLSGAATFDVPVVQRSGKNIILSKPRAYSRLTSATVEAFRAYRKQQEFDLDASIIVLYGPNGLGKTSFFDAIDFGCSGKIGRLFRGEREPPNFPRVSTHLDKPPGTGSVVLKGSTLEAENREQWTLTRGTGSPGTAWINDEKTDSKGVMTFLTRAEWVESKPRVKTLENLFRATHLFGQGEQELLVDFKRTSVIPQEFVSEMLALQDYSQAIAKLSAVDKFLTSQRKDFSSQLQQLQDQRESLVQLQADLPLSPESENIPLESLTDQFRQNSLDKVSPELGAPEVITIPAIDGWLDVASARIKEFEARLRLSNSVRDRLPAYRAALREIQLVEANLAKVDNDLQLLSTEEREITAKRDASNKSLEQLDLLLKRLDQQQRDLRSIGESQSRLTELKKRVEGDQSALDALQEEKEALGIELDSITESVNSSRAAHAELTQSLELRLAELRALGDLVRDFPEFDNTKSTNLRIQKELQIAQGAYIEAERINTEKRETAEAAERALKAFQPEYDRVQESQADLQQLLDKIQAHITNGCCPLCGSDFDTIELLIKRINKQRNQIASHREISVRYNELLATKSKASDEFAKSSAELAAATNSLSDLKLRASETRERMDDFRARHDLSNFTLNEESLTTNVLSNKNKGLNSEVTLLRERVEASQQEISNLDKQLNAALNREKLLTENINTIQRRVQEANTEIVRIESATLAILEREGIANAEIDSTLRAKTSEVQDQMAASQSLRSNVADIDLQLESLKTRIVAAIDARDAMARNLEEIRNSNAQILADLRSLNLAEPVKDEMINEVVTSYDNKLRSVRSAIQTAETLQSALRSREQRVQADRLVTEIKEVDKKIKDVEAKLAKLETQVRGGASLDRLLKAEQQSAIKKHISAYGPLITNIQQRLRSVYGFGGIELQAEEGEASVHVEWKNNTIKLPPTDFFSDSQKQILMLSIFLAGGLRQNWSGFAPVLLDDPVTHFDDLNAYGFVELVRGIVASEPRAWQFVISTCEDRLFSLMQKKFARIPGGAICYEFLGMSDDGPIVVRR